MKKCRLVKSKIKEGCRDEYLRMHKEIPPEIADEWKAVGVEKVVCFLDGEDLYVYGEYDDECAETPETTPVLLNFVKELEKCKDNSVPRKALEIGFLFGA